MSILPTALVDLIDELGRLPGVGPRSAERYAYFLLRQNPEVSNRLAKTISELAKNIKYCPITFMLINANEDMSSIYINPQRDKTTVAVVEEPLDVVALENTGSFSGVYHVLGGIISPIDGLTPEQLHIEELISRIKTDNVKELILATNASVEGESTALYIHKLVSSKYPKIFISRLARGLPAGVDLEYADHVTLSRAIEERQKI